MVRVTKCWLLIDWELARKSEDVWCNEKLLPEVTECNLIHAKGLWQLGMLIKAAAVCADVAITSYLQIGLGQNCSKYLGLHFHKSGDIVHLIEPIKHKAAGS